jgi:hypothetical protein
MIAQTSNDLGDTSAATQAKDAAAAVEELPRDWHGKSQSDQVNIIPFSGNVVADLAYSAQRPLLTAVVRSGALAAAYLFLLGVIILLALIVAATPSARAVPLAWRGRAGPALACTITLLPLLILLGIDMSGRIPYVWLFTAGSATATVLFLPLSLLMLAIAGRVAIRFPVRSDWRANVFRSQPHGRRRLFSWCFS